MTGAIALRIRSNRSGRFVQFATITPAIIAMSSASISMLTPSSSAAQSLNAGASTAAMAATPIAIPPTTTSGQPRSIT